MSHEFTEILIIIFKFFMENGLAFLLVYLHSKPMMRLLESRNIVDFIKINLNNEYKPPNNR